MIVRMRPTDEDHRILCIRGVFLPYEMQRPLQRLGVRRKRAFIRCALLTDTGMQNKRRLSPERYNFNFN